MPTVAEKRATFKRLHESGLFVMPNPWDVGSTRYLQGLGFKALATTSAGFAWTRGLRRRRRAARHDARPHRGTVGGGRRADQRRLRGRLCRRARGRGGERAAVRGDRRSGLRSRTTPARRTSRFTSSTWRWRGCKAARGGDRQGGRRRAADRAQRGPHPRPARPGRDDPPAQGLRGGRRRLPVCAGHRHARADRGRGGGGGAEAGQRADRRPERAHGADITGSACAASRSEGRWRARRGAVSCAPPS